VNVHADILDVNKVLLSVEFWITLKTYLKGAPFYNALQALQKLLKGKENRCRRQTIPKDSTSDRDLIKVATTGLRESLRSTEPSGSWRRFANSP
jgi:hypothetical protein